MNEPLKSLPDGATICSVKTEDTKTVINCAGFKHKFLNTVDAAKFLGVPWDQFNRMIDLNRTNPSMILLRRDHLEMWRPSNEVMTFITLGLPGSFFAGIA